MKTPSPQIILEAYGKSWSETDAAKRLQLLEQSLNPDCVYTDPLVQTTGYEPLSEYMAELQKNISGVNFVPTELKSHHDRTLMHWNMADGNGNILGQGASYFLHGADGRLKQMTGFFDPPNAG
jgi:SnoaL-like domain